MGNFVSYENATSLMTEVGNKFKALSGAYIPRGSSTFANLPSTLTKTMAGYVYNMTEDFTTTALFVEGTGKKYKAGANVVIVNVGSDAVPDMKFDVLGGFIDLDDIYEKIEQVSDMVTTDEFDNTQTYAVGDVVKYENTLYEFKAAHAAGDWNSTEVYSVTVKELIDEAEPESLTTAQVNALLALLD